MYVHNELGEDSSDVDPYKYGITLYGNKLNSSKKINFEFGQRREGDPDYLVADSKKAINELGWEPVFNNLNKIIGIFKAYVTRVGSGPFPTELFDSNGEELQNKGKEFGATTGRARRCGWFDLVAAKYSVEINGLTHIALTKLDILDNFNEIKVCTEYKYKGKTTSDFSSVLNNLSDVEPVYKTFKGWTQATSQVTEFNNFSESVKKYIQFLSHQLGTPISIISIGPRRNQIIHIET